MRKKNFFLNTLRWKWASIYYTDLSLKNHQLFSLYNLGERDAGCGDGLECSCGSSVVPEPKS